MRTSFEGVPRQTLDYLGREMPFGKRLVMANLWLFKPLVERQLSASPKTNSGTRTTTAATVIEGGIKENILPKRARAIVNFRPLPGDIDRVIAHVIEVVNDPRVKVSRFGSSNNEASAVSNMNAAGFRIIQRTMRQVFPEAWSPPDYAWVEQTPNTTRNCRITSIASLLSAFALKT